MSGSQRATSIGSPGKRRSTNLRSRRADRPGGLREVQTGSTCALEGPVHLRGHGRRAPRRGRGRARCPTGAGGAAPRRRRGGLGSSRRAAPRWLRHYGDHAIADHGTGKRRRQSANNGGRCGQPGRSRSGPPRPRSAPRCTLHRRATHLQPRLGGGPVRSCDGGSGTSTPSRSREHRTRFAGRSPVLRRSTDWSTRCRIGSTSRP